MAPRAVWRAISLATRLKRRGLANGALIEAAEQAGFALMVTTDENIGYQQNLEGRRLALMVLEHSQWPMVKLVTALRPSRQPYPAAFLRSRFRLRISTAT